MQIILDVSICNKFIIFKQYLVKVKYYKMHYFFQSAKYNTNELDYVSNEYSRPNDLPIIYLMTIACVKNPVPL